MRCRPAFLAGIFVVSLFLTGRAYGQGDEGTIVGEIRVQRGSFPSRKIEVRLEARGGMIGSTYSDDEGKFSFYSLKANLYHVLINDNDYLPVELTTEVIPFINHMNLVHVTLVPKA